MNTIEWLAINCGDPCLLSESVSKLGKRVCHDDSSPRSDSAFCSLTALLPVVQWVCPCTTHRELLQWSGLSSSNATVVGKVSLSLGLNGVTWDVTTARSVTASRIRRVSVPGGESSISPRVLPRMELQVVCDPSSNVKLMITIVEGAHFRYRIEVVKSVQVGMNRDDGPCRVYLMVSEVWRGNLRQSKKAGRLRSETRMGRLQSSLWYASRGISSQR